MTRKQIHRPRGLAGAAVLMLGGIVTTLLSGAVLITTTTETSAQGRCSDYVTHWGRRSDTRAQARENAYAGIEWKLRTQYAIELGVERGVQIDQCKRRDDGFTWQCQASAIVRTCAD